MCACCMEQYGQFHTNAEITLVALTSLRHDFASRVRKTHSLWPAARIPHFARLSARRLSASHACSRSSRLTRPVDAGCWYRSNRYHWMSVAVWILSVHLVRTNRHPDLRHLAHVGLLRPATIPHVQMKILSWCYLFPGFTVLICDSAYWTFRTSDP